MTTKTLTLIDALDLIEDRTDMDFIEDKGQGFVFEWEAGAFVTVSEKAVFNRAERLLETA